MGFLPGLGRIPFEHIERNGFARDEILSEAVSVAGMGDQRREVAENLAAFPTRITIRVVNQFLKHLVEFRGSARGTARALMVMRTRQNVWELILAFLTTPVGEDSIINWVTFDPLLATRFGGINDDGKMRF